MVFCFIQWVIICYYYYLFWCSNCPQFGWWESLQEGLCILLKNAHHSLNTSLLSGITRCSRCILFFSCPYPVVRHCLRKCKMVQFYFSLCLLARTFFNYKNKNFLFINYTGSFPWDTVRINVGVLPFTLIFINYELVF